MGDELRISRVLIAQPGSMAVRLARHFRERGIETVVAFCAADAEAWWVEEADFDAYIDGPGPAETYLDAARLIAAAMDAGCDAVHPGCGPMCESVDLYHIANNANVAVLSGDPSTVVHAIDRTFQRGYAERLKIPTLPGSRALPPASDGLVEASPLPLPIAIRSTWGPVLDRVEQLAQLPDRLARAHEVARDRFNHDVVYLVAEPDPRRAEHAATLVVADKHGATRALARCVTLLASPGRRPWLTRAVARSGYAEPAAEEALDGQGAALVKALRWVGAAAVRWVRIDDHTYLDEVTLGLPPGFELVEELLSIDLVGETFELLEGGAVSSPVDLDGSRVGLHARVEWVGGAEETVERLELPEGTIGAVQVGDVVGPMSDPLLLHLTAIGEDEGEARVRLMRLLDQVVVEGVATNLAALREGVATGGPRA